MKKDFNTVSAILKESEHAEILEEITENFGTARRIMVLMELEANGGSKFRFYLNGFKQFYEIDGFLRCFDEIIHDEQEAFEDEQDG